MQARIDEPGRLDPVAVFAHDMRGPLANLSLLIEALGARAAAEGRHRAAEQADKAERIIERLDGMLTAMLARARRQAQPLEPTREDVNLAELIETVAALNRPLAERRGVRLHCLTADPLRTHGDCHLLMQALDNLLTNAITFSRRGGRVTCEAMLTADGGIVVRIADCGPGFAPEEIARAFQPFAGLTSRPDTARQSCGIGLAVVRCIAEAHGGTVSAANRTPGKGAVLTLRLPVRRG
jgi:signal transduction histidine kinase